MSSTRYGHLSGKTISSVVRVGGADRSYLFLLFQDGSSQEIYTLPGSPGLELARSLLPLRVADITQRFAGSEVRMELLAHPPGQPG